MKTRRTLGVLTGVLLLSVITAVMLWPESGPQQAAPASSRQAAALPPPIEAPLPSQEVAAATAEVAATGEDATPSVLGVHAVVVQPQSQPDFSKLDAFDNWMARWKAASPEEREGLLDEGGKLVAERRPEYKALISFDPRQAVERAVKRVDRQDLPGEITSQLETPVSAAGALGVFAYAPDASGKAPAGGAVQRFFETGGVRYKAYVPEELMSMSSFKRTPLQGYADGDDFAVAPNAVRVLDVGEKIPAGTTVQTKCLVSGKNTESISTGEAVTTDTPVVQIGDETIALCDPSHAVVLADEYRNYSYAYASGGSSSGYFVENFPGNPSITIGSFRFLHMRLAFPERPAAQESEETAREYMNYATRFFIENSYGKLVPTTTYTPVLMMPRTVDSYKASGGSHQIYADAVQVAKGLGYDIANYQSCIARGPDDWNSFAEITGPRIYLGKGVAGVVMHEAGHGLGQNHANFWATTDGTGYGTGANEEYGSWFDIMGADAYSNDLNQHYNTVSKTRLTWLQPNFIHTPTTNGQFRIYAYDQPKIEVGKRYAFHVAKNNVRGYNIEYHPAYSAQLADQALVIFDGLGSNSGHLIDTTPDSPGGKNDGGIAIGRTFSDWDSDQHFTVVAKNATTPASIDLVYNRGPFPGNVAPTTGLTASATTVAVGGSVTFTATGAADANGDPLAYHWQFDDGVQGTNTSIFTRTFTTAAQVNAMLTVSDQKGGTVRRSVVINVGAHGKQAITGTVTEGGNPLAGVLIKSGSKFCYSNGDGSYSLAGLSTGANTLTAALPGYSFTPSTANPYTVVTGTNTVNWTAANATRVTLSKTAEPTEGGANGNFRLTRTGSTTAALTVFVTPVGGTATKTTDYTFAPDYVTAGNFKSFTIPAGSATLDIAVAAVNDTTAEGPETIALQLVLAAGYVSGGANSLVMTVSDNDSALPLVAVTAPDPYATESAGSTDTGKFTFTRTGSTAAALNLTVAWSGTAINGSDYTALPTTVSIPAGQSSVDVFATPANDSLIEVPEDVVVTLSTSAAYLRDTSATTARVLITDDDTPVVTVSVPDANASENGQDVGTFLLTRTGDTSAPLTVYYGLTGSASYGADYASQTGQVTIPAGAISAPVVILPHDDAIGETVETIILTVTIFNDAYTLGSIYQGSLTLTDNNDLALVSVRSGATGTEGGSNATVIFNSTGSGSGNITVNYTVSGTATAGSDYTSLTGTVSVPLDGTNEATVSIPITNDTVAEGTETVVVTITPGTGYKVYNDARTTALIRDNDSGGERVSVSTLDRILPSESGTPAGNFHFFRAVGTTGDLTVNYTVSGTAINGTDYTTLSGTCVIPAAASGVTVPMIPNNDTLAEGTETITVTVNSGAGYSADYPFTATLELLDNDANTRTVGFQNTSLSTTEQPDALGEYRDLPVILSAASTSTVTVRCISGGGDALGDGGDWAFVDATNGNQEIPYGIVTFPPGTTSQNLRIRVRNDGYLESAEIVVLKLEAPVNAGLTDGRGFQSVAIFDHQIVSGLITEERWNSTAVYTNNTWSTVAPDYYNGLLTSFTPPVQNVGEIFSRRLTGQIVAPATGTYTFWIAGSDPARLYLSTNSSAANKAQIATVSSATNFQDWDAYASQKSASITLTAGQSYYMEVQHSEDSQLDHVSVAWQGPGFSRKPIAISEPESQAPRFVGTLVSATTRTETDGSEPLLQVVLDRPAGSTPVTVNYSTSGTATAGSDYTLAPGTLTFAAGEQMKPLPLSILADAVTETPEAIVVTLANPTGAQLGSSSTHVITLLEVGAPAVETLVTAATSAMGSGTSLGTVVATPAAGRSITGWQLIAGNIGNAFALNAAGQLTLATPGALPNPGGMQLVVRATDNTGATGDGVVNVICNALVQGVVEERWNGSTAFNSNTWTGTPAYSGSLATFTAPQNVAENYSRRITGCLQPTATGNYTFWVASDDGCRLYLSSDGSPSNKTQIAAVSSYTNFQSWDSLAGQKSAVIPLVAGQVYWLEVHHLEGGGGDHVSVAWQGPGISRQAIPASAIFPNFGTPPVPPTIALTSPVNGAEFDSGDNVTLAASVAGGSIAVSTVEFYRGSTLIGSDSSAPYSVTWGNAIAGNHVLTTKAIYNGGGVTSSGVTVSVQDVDPASDPDGDGFTTGLELALGTDPHSSASQPSSLYANLRAWWKLDESSGTSADDATGRNQDGALLNAPAWTTGLSGGALALNGTNQSVQIPALNLNSNTVTVSAWVKRNGTQSQWTGLVFSRESVASGLNLGPANDLRYHWNNAANTYDFASGLTLPDNTWTFCALVVEPTKATLYMQPAGGTMQSAVNTVSHAASAFSGTNTYLGQDSAGGRNFKGSLDEVRVYARALGSTEIGDLYESADPPHAPAFTADPIVKTAATEDSAYTGSLAGSASDPDPGDSMTYSKVSGPAWLSVAANGALTGTAGNGNVGPNSFTVRVTDGSGLSDDATLSITVNNVNDAPAFAADPMNGSNATEDQAYTGTLAGTASDIDAADTATYSKVSGPAWLSIASNGALSGTPSNGNVGPNSFTVRVTDGGGLTDNAVFNITVTNVNDAPVFTANPITGGGAAEGAAYSGTLAGSATDVDASETLTYSKVSGPAWLGVTSGGALSGTPTSGDVGANSFTVRVIDAGGLSDDATLNIAVTSSSGNGVWVNAAGGSWNTPANWNGGVLASGANKLADFSSLNLTADTAVTLDGARTLGGMIFGDTTPSHNWILNTGIAGPLTLDVTTGNPLVTVNNQTATISSVIAGNKGLIKAGAGKLTLNGVNSLTGSVTVNSGILSLDNQAGLDSTSAITVNAGATFEIPAGGSDRDFGGAVVLNGGKLLNRTWTFSYKPIVLNAGDQVVEVLGNTFHLFQSNGKFTGVGNLIKEGTTALVVYSNAAASDFTGATTVNAGLLRLENGTNSKFTATSAVTIAAGANVEFLGNERLNDAASVTANGNLKLSGNMTETIASLNGTNSGQVSNIAVGTAATIVIGANNGNGSFAGAIVNGSGTIALSKIGAGTQTLAGVNTYTGTTTVGGGVLNVTGTLAGGAVTVQSGGTLAGSGTLGGATTVASGGTLNPSGTLAINNSLSLAGTTQMDVNKAGATLTRDEITGITTVTYGGTLNVTATGDALAAGDTLQLFNATNYSGSFTATNLPALTSGLVWDVSKLAIDGTITVGSIPQAMADASSVAEDGLVSINVLANDSDADNDTLSIQSATQGAHGSVSILGNTVTYTPAANWYGTDSFNYTITDNQDGTSAESVSVTVTPVNDAPLFGSFANGNATEDVVFTGSVASAASDIDSGDTLTFSKVSGPTWLSVAGNGAISGTPSNANVGVNNFVIRVTDGSGAFDESALSITVANVNDAPVFAADPVNLNATEDTAFNGQLAATDADASESQTYLKVSGPAWLSVSTSGALSGTPTNSQVGANAFTVRVTDGSGASDEAALNITVANANDAPVFTVDPIIATDATLGTAYTGQTLAGAATDADAGGAITYTKVSGPAWLSVATNGALSGTPPSGSGGLNSFVVRATDASSASDDAELRINVLGLPLPWTSGDIGTGMLAGSASHSSGTFTLSGSGALGGSTDKLQFTYQTLTGDGEIIARVSALGGSGNSSRVGVMIRDTLATNSRQAFFGLTSAGNYRWERRYSIGGSNVTINSGSGIAPNTWVRLVRSGSMITAYKSSDGITWTLATSGTVTMATNCYIGLAVSSGSDTTSNTSQFSNVSVTP